MLIKLMASDCNVPVNIGNNMELSVNEIVKLIVNEYSNASTFEIKLPINHVYNLRLSFDSKVMTYKFINR